MYLSHEHDALPFPPDLRASPSSCVANIAPVLFERSPEIEDRCQNRCLPPDGATFFLVGPRWSDAGRVSAWPGDGGTAKSLLSDPSLEDSALGRASSGCSTLACLSVRVGFDCWTKLDPAGEGGKWSLRRRANATMSTKQYPEIPPVQTSFRPLL